MLYITRPRCPSLSSDSKIFGWKFADLTLNDDDTNLKLLLYKDEMAGAPTQKHLSEVLSDGGIHSAVGMIWVMDSIPWVRCAAGNVFVIPRLMFT